MEACTAQLLCMVNSQWKEQSLISRKTSLLHRCRTAASKLRVQRWLHCFLIKYILRKATATRCNTRPSWGSWGGPGLSLIAGLWRRGEQLYYCPCHLQCSTRRAEVLLGWAKRVRDCWCCPAEGGAAGAHSREVSPPPFLPVRMDGEKWFILTKYRHDSSLLAYFQDNMFKNQLRPSRLFSVAWTAGCQIQKLTFLRHPLRKTP